jgi:general secretion pathway protein L
MPQTLLIRLPEPGAEETEWLKVDESGAPAGLRQRGTLLLAAAVARSSKVVVLAPATQILIAEPELPPGSGVKLARAVPFALEEQLTEDIDRLSFAVGRRRAGGGTPVAVVSRTLLQGWLTELGAAGIEPVALYADMALLPDNPSQTVLWLEQGRLAIRRPGALPFVVELASATDALVVAGIIADPLETVAEPKPLENAILYVTREDWANAQDEFERLADKFGSLKIQLLAEGPLPLLARELGAGEAVNLLQGEFIRSTDYGARWLQWRTAAILAVSLLVVHVAAQALEIHQANRRSTALDGEIAQVFAAAMPAEKLEDPRRQMQTRLDRIRHSGAGPQYFLRTLQTLSGALAQSPQTRIDALSYHEQSLDLKVTAPSLAALSQLSQQLEKQNLAADIQSSTPVDSGVEAHLQIKPRGSRPQR